MKKAIPIALILALALNLPGQIHWNKYPDNPVMLASPAGLWDEVLVFITRLKTVTTKQDILTPAFWVA